MDNLLAISFDDQPAPYEALTRLKELDEQGQIGVIEGAVVERDGQGRLLISDEVKEHDTPGRKTVSGGVIGLLVGIIGGPVGVLIGGTVGSLVGAAFDLSPRDEAHGLLAQYSRHIAVGKTAVLAHLDEPDDEIVDAAMSALGGAVLRQPIADVRAEIAVDRPLRDTTRRSLAEPLDEERDDLSRPPGPSDAEVPSRQGAAPR